MSYTVTDAIRFYNKMRGIRKARPAPKKQVSNTRSYLEGSCRLCGVQNPLEVHHIVPIAIAGRTTKQNCVTLCKGCHKTISKYLIMVGIMDNKTPKELRAAR